MAKYIFNHSYHGIIRKITIEEMEEDNKVFIFISKENLEYTETYLSSYNITGWDSFVKELGFYLNKNHALVNFIASNIFPKFYAYTHTNDFDHSDDPEMDEFTPHQDKIS